MPDQCATCGAGDALLFRCEDCGRQFCTDHTQPDHECVAAATAPAEATAGTTGEEGVGFEWGAGAPGTGQPNTGSGRTDPFDESGFRPPDAIDTRAPRSSGRSGEAAPRTVDGGTSAVRPAPPEPRSPPTGTVSAVRPAPRTVPEGLTSAVERVVEPRRIEGAARAAVRPAGPQPREVDHGAGVRQAVRPDTGRVPDRRPVDDPEPLLADAGAASTAGRGGTPATGAGTTTSSADSTADTTPIRPMDMRDSPDRAERREPRTMTEWLHQQTYVSLTVKTGAIAAAINAALYFGMLLATSGLLEQLLS